MRVRTKEQRATLHHPVYPEVFAEVRRLTDIQKLQQREALRDIQKKTTVIPIRDVDGKDIRDAVGNLETREIAPVAELIEHSLKVSIVTVGGLEEEDGTPIPFENNWDNVFAHLWGDELAFDEEIPAENGGPPTSRHTSFAMWLARQAGRKETFDSDPLAKSSPTPQPA